MNERDKAILVVDDAPENIQLLSGLLKARYRVKAATSGEKALQAVRKPPVPVLVLLDVMMPGMDGYEVCRQLRADELTRDIPVVFVSGHTSEAERERGMDVGADGFLAKPVEPEALYSAVERALGAAGEERRGE